MRAASTVVGSTELSGRRADMFTDLGCADLLGRCAEVCIGFTVLGSRELLGRCADRRAWPCRSSCLIFKSVVAVKECEVRFTGCHRSALLAAVAVGYGTHCCATALLLRGAAAAAAAAAAAVLCLLMCSLSLKGRAVLGADSLCVTE